MKRLAVLLLVLLLTLVAAVPAHADKPVVWADFDFVSDWPYVDCRVLGQGYNFTIWINQHGHEKQTAYYDRNGNVVRLLIDNDGLGYLYNENNPSFSIPNTYHITGHHDPTVSTITETTLPLNLVYNSDRERCPCHTKLSFSPVTMVSMRPM